MGSPKKHAAIAKTALLLPLFRATGAGLWIKFAALLAEFDMKGALRPRTPHHILTCGVLPTACCTRENPSFFVFLQIELILPIMLIL